MTEEQIKLFEDNQKLVPHIIGRIQPRKRGYDFEDWVQLGLVALWKAAESFDPSRKVQFSTFAYKAIHRAVLRPITSVYRDNQYDEFVKHSLSEEAFRYRNGNESLQLEDVIPSNGVVEDAVIAKVAVSDVIKRLNEREKYVLKRAYLDGAQQFKIGNELGVSQQTVANIRKGILVKFTEWETGRKFYAEGSITNMPMCKLNPKKKRMKEKVV